MDISPEFVQAGIMTNPQQLLGTIAGALMVGGTLTKGCTVVHQGEMSLRLRRGSPRLKPEYEELLKEQVDMLDPDGTSNYSREDRDELVDLMIDGLTEEQREQGVYRIKGRGIKLFIPGFEKVVKINVAHNTSALSQKPIDITSREKIRYQSEGATATWQVSRKGDNPYKALIKLNNEKDNKDKDKLKELTETVASISRRGLSRVLGGMSAEDLDKFHDQDTELITKLVREKCQDDLWEWGVNLHRVWLPQVVPVGEEILKEGLMGRDGNDPAGAGLAAGYAAAAGKAERGEGDVVPIRPAPDAA